MKSGDFYFLLSSFASFALEGGYGIHQTGGTLKSVGMRFGEPINSPIFGGYTSGLYGKFGANISQAELIGTIKKNNISDASSFENYAGSKLDINHSIYHIGW